MPGYSLQSPPYLVQSGMRFFLYEARYRSKLSLRSDCVPKCKDYRQRHITDIEDGQQKLFLELASWDPILPTLHFSDQLFSPAVNYAVDRDADSGMSASRSAARVSLSPTGIAYEPYLTVFRSLSISFCTLHSVIG